MTLEDPLRGRAQNVAKAKAARGPPQHEDAPPPKRICVPFVTPDTLLIEKRVQEDKTESFTVLCS